MGKTEKFQPRKVSIVGRYASRNQVKWSFPGFVSRNTRNFEQGYRFTYFSRTKPLGHIDITRGEADEMCLLVLPERIECLFSKMIGAATTDRIHLAAA